MKCKSREELILEYRARHEAMIIDPVYSAPETKERLKRALAAWLLQGFKPENETKH